MPATNALPSRVVALLLLSACTDDVVPPPTWSNADTSIHVAKWPRSAAGAISLTYDSALIDSEPDRTVRRIARLAGIPIEYEFVSGFYAQHPKLAESARQLIAGGQEFFCHGHVHEDHDALDWEQKLASVRRCREALRSFGSTSLSFAYPGGAGHRQETRRAVAESGFLSARLFRPTADPLIAPGSNLRPSDWYGLPTAVVQDRSFADCEPCVNDSQQLSQLLDRVEAARAWVILTYHSIGKEDGWGYYPITEFRSDLAAIARRVDFPQSRGHLEASL